MLKGPIFVTKFLEGTLKDKKLYLIQQFLSLFSRQQP